jgi:hypothetical protein
MDAADTGQPDAGILLEASDNCRSEPFRQEHFTLLAVMHLARDWEDVVCILFALQRDVDEEPSLRLQSAEEAHDVFLVQTLGDAYEKILRRLVQSRPESLVVKQIGHIAESFGVSVLRLQQIVQHNARGSVTSNSATYRAGNHVTCLGIVEPRFQIRVILDLHLGPATLIPVGLDEVATLL